MVWDLGRAMRKKEEFESARLMDFEFRQRARATRLLARAHGMDEQALVRGTAAQGESEMIDAVAAETGVSPSDVASEYARYMAVARAQLIAERGDPTPHRLG